MNRFTRLLTLCLVLVTASAFGQAPVNNECSGAITLTVDPTGTNQNYYNANNSTATASPAIPGATCTGNTNDVWFKFIATSPDILLSIPWVTLGPGIAHITFGAAVYSGTCGNFTEVACSDELITEVYIDGTLVNSPLPVIGLTVGQTYYIKVWTESIVGVVSGNSFLLSVGALPPNDNCAGAINLTVGTTGNCVNAITTNNTGATSSPSTGGACTNANHDVWFKFTAVSNGANVRIPFADQGANSMMRLGGAVYSGSCGNLTPIACDHYMYDNNSMQTYVNPLHVTGLIIGQTYYIRVWTQGYTEDPYPNSFSICVLIDAPLNDVSSGAIPLTVGAPCTSPIYTNLGATRTPAIPEPGGGVDPYNAEPFPMCSYQGSSQGQHSVWYSFTAPPGGAVKVTTDNGVLGTLTNTKIALFSINNFSTGYGHHILGCDDDNGANNGTSDLLSTMYATGLTPNATYYIEVDGFSAGAAGVGTFCLEVHELDSSMVANSASCTQANPAGLGYDYFSWVSIADDAGKLVALIKSNAGPDVSSYHATYNIDGNGLGTPRQDANGTYYLGRNYMISNPSTWAPEVKFFFRTAELNALTAATGGAVNLSNLNVTRQESNVCHANFLESNGVTSVVPRVGSGSVNGVSWIQANPPGLSNFYLMGGTVPLALSLERIDARNEGRSNLVSWTTAKEDQGDYFELERSADGRNFSFLATVAAKGQPSAYTYWDNNPVQGVSYYRLKMINADKKPVYSDVVTAIVGQLTAFSLQAYPNPVNNSLILEISGTREADASLTISDATGRVLQTVNVTSGEVKIDMTGFAAGFYLVEYKDALHRQTVKVSKQ